MFLGNFSIFFRFSIVKPLFCSKPVCLTSFLELLAFQVGFCKNNEVWVDDDDLRHFGSFMCISGTFA